MQGAVLEPVIVFFVCAGVFFYLVIFDVPYFIGYLANKMAVVRDNHKSAGILLQRLDKDVFGYKIEVVGGFIQQQEVSL